MRVTGFMQFSYRGKTSLPSVSVRAVEKINAASTLKRELPDAPPPRHKTVPRFQVELVCQDETGGFDPFRDAPKLSAAFAAQILGQAMAPGHGDPSACAAYRPVHGTGAHLLNRRA
jgi:hypothetical protein